jgi:hypothetical protein
VKISAIIQARAIAFMELYDLDPRGRTFFPEIIEQIRQRYGFLQAPKIEELDEQKGVELKTGKFGNKVIDVLKIFPHLFALETHSSTSDSKMILEDMFEWAKKELGITYEPSMIEHWGYVSILTFYSECNIIALDNSPASKLAAKMSNAVSEIWEEPVVFEPRGMSIGHDPLSRKNSIASLLITPRAEVPYSENKFYSEAPLPTDTHIKLLEEFEADVLAASKQ